MEDLNIIIPVYQEQKNIKKTLTKILKIKKIKYTITVIYDYNKDPTIQVIKKNFKTNKIRLIKNKHKFLNGAVKTAYETINAKAYLFYAADDHNNFKLIPVMFKKFKEGYDMVCASRYILGGNLKNYPIFKIVLKKIIHLTLKIFIQSLITDPTNGFKLFSKDIIKKFPITSKKGFTFNFEIFVKAYLSGYKFTEVPENWEERNFGKSKFRYYELIYYIPWYLKLIFNTSNKNF
tara:strand:+ start:1077 stop:1778 length:702 start_codon:yes stop_codon:yes gene_type:complete